MSKKQITERNKNKEREFSLEKIATAIHCENIISSLRNKYIDPLIIRRKHLLPKTKSKQLKKNKLNDPFSLNKILYHEYIKQNPKQETEEEKAIQTNNNLSNNVLPKITNKHLQQITSNNNFNEYNSNGYTDNLLVTSGMFKQKEYCKDPLQRVKLGSIYHLKNNTSEENIINNYYPKIENIKEINEIYNLQLDLKHLTQNDKTIPITKKMSKKSLMNFLFKKYTTCMNSNEDNLSNENNRIKKRHKTKIKTILSKQSTNTQNNDEPFKTNSNNNSYDSDNMSIDIFKKELLNEEKNTFITRVNIPKKETIEISGYNSDISPKKNLKIRNIKLYEKNRNIITHDQKVTIDCLYSNVRAKIEPNKLVYKSIEKTTYQLQKEPSYKKVKKFESIIDKIIKTQNKKIISKK